MSVTGPNVRDFTDQERPLPVSVDSGLLYELMTALYVFAVDTDDSDLAHEMTAALTTAVDDHDPALKDELRSLTDCELGLTLVGVAQNLEGERTVTTLIEKLRTEGAIALRKLLMANCGVKAAKGYDPELIESAAAGDADAVKQIVDASERTKSLEPLLTRQPDVMLDDVISVVERFTAAVEPLLAARQHLLDRDAANGRAMAKTVRPDRLIEKLTNGVTFVLQPEVGEVVLIPSIVVRPWVVITEHHSTRIFVYSVSDAVLSADPDAPPAFLVDTFKALGDENRLRLLGVLAEGNMGLKEIATRVDLAKSTAHHHLRILRSAGLVRVIVSDDDKCYSLRRDAVDGSGRLLSDFLDSRADLDRNDLDPNDLNNEQTQEDGKE